MRMQIKSVPHVLATQRKQKEQQQRQQYKCNLVKYTLTIRKLQVIYAIM